MLDRARLEPDDVVLDVGTGTGLLVFGALDRLGPDGSVVALDISVDCLEELRATCDDPRVAYLVGGAEVLPLPDESVDVVLTRSVLIYVREKAEAAREFFRVLRPGGRVSLFEPVNRRNTQLWELVDFGDLSERVAADFYRRWPPDHPMQDFDAEDMAAGSRRRASTNVDADVVVSSVTVTPDAVLHGIGAPGSPSLLDAWRESFSAEEVAQLEGGRTGGGADGAAVAGALPRRAQAVKLPSRVLVVGLARSGQSRRRRSPSGAWTSWSRIASSATTTTRAARRRRPPREEPGRAGRARARDGGPHAADSRCGARSSSATGCCPAAASSASRERTARRRPWSCWGRSSARPGSRSSSPATSAGR